MQPTPYIPEFTFPESPHTETEFANVATTLDGVLGNLAIIQRDDTLLQDGIVSLESLSANVKALFGTSGNPRGAWITLTSYAVKDVVETGSPLIAYMCVIAHTSDVFATDRAAGKWMVLGQDVGAGVFASLTLTTGGIILGTNNTQDLAATANRFRSGYFGTSLFAAVSVVTPTVTAASVSASSSLTSPILDSGSGSLILKGAGSTAATITGTDTLLAGKLSFSTAASKIIPGATSLALRNNADSADNLLVSDAGVVTTRSGLVVSSGTITPTQTGGIVGTTTNNNAQAGSIGEYTTASLAVGSQLSLTTGVAVNITSISLTAGDWDVDGVLHFNYGAADAAISLIGSASTTSATHGAVDTQAVRVFPSAGQVQSNQTAHRMPLPTNRITLNSTTTVFLVATANFTGGYACHGMIRARRVR